MSRPNGSLLYAPDWPRMDKCPTCGWTCIARGNQARGEARRAHAKTRCPDELRFVRRVSPEEAKEHHREQARQRALRPHSASALALDYVRKHPGASHPEIQRACGRQAGRALARLIRKGHLTRTGPRGHYQYHPAPAAPPTAPAHAPQGGMA